MMSISEDFMRGAMELNRSQTTLVRRIGGRAQDKLGYNGFVVSVAIVQAHIDCPLDFKKLWAFDDFNFAHDVVGIMRKMDYRTGRLDKTFLPRCAKPDKEAVIGNEGN